MKETNPKEDQVLFIGLVLVPIGLLAAGYIWSKYGFGYALITAAIFVIGAIRKFFTKK